MTTDVADEVAVRTMVAAAVERWGTVDILVNNAWGGGSLGRLEYKTNEQMDHGLRVGFFWAVLGHAGRIARHARPGPRQHHQPLLAQRGECPHRDG